MIPEIDSDKARSLHAQAMAAPAIWLAEAANVLWRRVRLNELSEEEAGVLFRQLRAASFDSIPIENDVERALNLGIQIGHPIYDCLYLALAIREQTWLATGDARFVSAVRRDGRWSANVRLLSEL